MLEMKANVAACQLNVGKYLVNTSNMFTAT